MAVPQAAPRTRQRATLLSPGRAAPRQGKRKLCQRPLTGPTRLVPVQESGNPLSSFEEGGVVAHPSLLASGPGPLCRYSWRQAGLSSRWPGDPANRPRSSTEKRCQQEAEA